MYLLYVDESGRPKGLGDDHLVVAGIAFHESDCYQFARSLVTVQRRHVGPAFAQLEIHATDIWAGRRGWAKISQPVRHRLLSSLFRHIAAWVSADAPGRRPVLFGAAVHKPSFPATAMERAHEELFSRFDEYLTRLHRAGESHRSLIVADDSSYERVLQTLTPMWMEGTRRLPRLNSLVEVPLYVDSQASRLVQAADLVAWAIWQYYEHGHSAHLQALHPRIDADRGIQHGLVHLRRGWKTCPCVPCVSRLTQNIAPTLPPYP